MTIQNALILGGKSLFQATKRQLKGENEYVLIRLLLWCVGRWIGTFSFFTVWLLVCRMKKGCNLNIRTFCCIKLAFFVTISVFGACFRTLAVSHPCFVCFSTTNLGVVVCGHEPVLCEKLKCCLQPGSG